MRRVVLVLALVAGALVLPATAGGPAVRAAADAPALAAPDDPTPPTVNEFLPEDRNLSDCISALPKPGCGSEARGGWRQGVILLAILVALGFIGWRIVRAARHARTEPAAPRGPDARTAHEDRAP